VGIASDKKPAGPWNSFIIRPASLASLALSAVLFISLGRARQRTALSQISVSVMPLVNYRLVLPFRRASATFIWDLSRMRIPPRDRFIELYRSALIAARDIGIPSQGK